jgi:Domain of Unknown Function (DUF1080)/GMC oxidoreductase
MLNQLIDSQKPFSSSTDIQETNFSLDGISRFVCNTYSEILDAQRQGNWQFDVIVVGSGMYGGYVASKLSRPQSSEKVSPGFRILVLEAGPFFISEHFQNLTRMGNFFQLVNKPVVDPSQTFVTQINLPPSAPLQGISPHHRCVGGKSLFWGGWAPRLLPDDFSRKDDQGKQLWPKEVVDFLNSPEGYAFTEEQIGVNATTDFVRGEFNDLLKNRIQSIIDGGDIPGLNEVRDAPIAVQAQSPESGLFSIDKFSSLPLLLSSLRDDADASNGVDKNRSLFLVPNAEVLKLETSNGVVNEIVINLKEPSSDSNFPGLQQRIVRLNLKEGAMVLLAGNTINSTRLALNSFPANGIKSAEMMGKNLMAHVRGNYFWRVHRSALQLGTNENPIESFSTSALHIAGVADDENNNFPKGHFHFQFYAVGSTGNDPEEYLYRSLPHLDDIQKVRNAVLSTNIRDWIVVGNRSCGEMFGNKKADTSGRSASFISVNPFHGSGDDVYFENGREIRIPKAFICLVQTPADAEIRRVQTNAAFDLIAELSGQDKILTRQRINNDKLMFISGGEDAMGSTYHESGTLCMGNDPLDSVTDSNGHFHHVANAYCADQSLFPTVGSANPVPTGLALCQKIAKHIRSRFTSTSLAPLEPGYTSLFDGSLNDWKFFGAGTIQSLAGLSIIEAGSAGTDSVLGFLRYEKQKFRNFNLKLDYKSFSIHANSGIFLRMPEIDNIDFDTLYSRSVEIQIDETGKNFIPSRIGETVYGSPFHKTGAVYGIAPATKLASKAISPRGADGYWNSFEIEVHEKIITVKLNDQLVCEAELPDFLTAEGFIALQCHTDIVQFRNIRIKSI